MFDNGSSGLEKIEMIFTNVEIEGKKEDMMYSYKEKKLRNSEQRSYAETKELYEIKIQNLKYEIKRLKYKGDKEIQTVLLQISEIFDEIAEFKILL